MDNSANKNEMEQIQRGLEAFLEKEMESASGAPEGRRRSGQGTGRAGNPDELDIIGQSRDREQARRRWQPDAEEPYDEGWAEEEASWGGSRSGEAEDDGYGGAYDRGYDAHGDTDRTHIYRRRNDEPDCWQDDRDARDERYSGNSRSAKDEGYYRRSGDSGSQGSGRRSRDVEDEGDFRRSRDTEDERYYRRDRDWEDERYYRSGRDAEDEGCYRSGRDAEDEGRYRNSHDAQEDDFYQDDWDDDRQDARRGRRYEEPGVRGRYQEEEPSRGRGRYGEEEPFRERERYREEPPVKTRSPQEGRPQKRGRREAEPPREEDSRMSKKAKKQEKAPKKKPRRKKHRLLKFLIGVAVLFALLGFGLYQLVGVVYGKMAYKEIAAYTSLPMSEDGVVNILLIGNDSRQNGEDGRSDAMILLSISSRTRKIYMTSLLRDMYVKIPGHDDNRLNAAYSFGGAELLMETIQLNFDIPVNRYMLVNFGAFVNLVEAVGGIDLELTNDEVTWVNNYLVEYNILTDNPQGTFELDPTLSGMVHLNGPQALAYSRNRFLGTDFGRTERQRKILTEVIKKMPSAVLTNAGGLIDGLMPNLTTNLTRGECFRLSLMAGKLIAYDIVSDSIPQSGTYKDVTIRKMAVLEVDFEANIRYLKEILYGE